MLSRTYRAEECSAPLHVLEVYLKFAGDLPGHPDRSLNFSEIQVPIRKMSILDTLETQKE